MKRDTYEQGGDQPEDCGKENECYVRLPLLASIVLCDASPVEDRTAVERADELFTYVS